MLSSASSQITGLCAIKPSSVRGSPPWAGSEIVAETFRMTMLPGQLPHSSPKGISSALPRLPCRTDLLLNPSGKTCSLCLARALRQGIPVPSEFLLSVLLEGYQRVRPIQLLLLCFAKPRCPPDQFIPHPSPLSPEGFRASDDPRAQETWSVEATPLGSYPRRQDCGRYPVGT